MLGRILEHSVLRDANYLSSCIDCFDPSDARIGCPAVFCYFQSLTDVSETNFSILNRSSALCRPSLVLLFGYSPATNPAIPMVPNNGGTKRSYSSSAMGWISSDPSADIAMASLNAKSGAFSREGPVCTAPQRAVVAMYSVELRQLSSYNGQARLQPLPVPYRPRNGAATPH
jgi:hypothetical protein